MSGKLAGKAALITGASRGLGRAMAVGYAREGADLALAARTMQDVEETAAMCREHGARAVTIECDVTSEDQVNAMVQRAMAEYDRIDIMINNAGQGPSHYTNPMPRLWELDDEEWERIWTVNLTGPFLCMKAALPIMQPGSSMINIISISGRRLVNASGAYPMSKYVLEMMTKLVAEEQRGRGVRLNALCPGAVAESGFWDIAGTRPAWSLNAVPPDVIVPAAVFLGSDESSDVIGQAYFGKWFNDQVAATGQAPHQGI